MARCPGGGCVPAWPPRPGGIPPPPGADGYFRCCGAGHFLNASYSYRPLDGEGVSLPNLDPPGEPLLGLPGVTLTHFDSAGYAYDPADGSFTIPEGNALLIATCSFSRDDGLNLRPFLSLWQGATTVGAGGALLASSTAHIARVAGPEAGQMPTSTNLAIAQVLRHNQNTKYYVQLSQEDPVGVVGLLDVQCTIAPVL